VQKEDGVKTVLLLLGGIGAGVLGAFAWLAWYFRDVMK
jgi:hypothetical protein